MSVLTARQILEKQPSEYIRATMDFTNWLTNGAILQSGVLSLEPDDGNLVATLDTLTDQTIDCLISSGIAGKNYRFNFIVWTSSGNTLEADGLMKCRDA